MWRDVGTQFSRLDIQPFGKNSQLGVENVTPRRVEFKKSLDVEAGSRSCCGRRNGTGCGFLHSQLICDGTTWSFSELIHPPVGRRS